MKRVAFIGLGVMGAAMARNLLAAGFGVRVYNRSRERAEALAQEGAVVCGSAAETASEAEVVVSMVSDDEASRAVFLGAEGVLSGAKPGTILIECSTLTPDWIAELNKAAAAKGCTLLDAPVTGSKPQAEGGELLFLVGGDAKAAEEAGSLFDAMGRAALYLGPSGSGSKTKLINNFLSGVQAASLGEAIALTEKLGLDRDKVLNVLTNGAPGSPGVKKVSERMLAQDYGIRFGLGLMLKDLTYAQKLGAQAGMRLETAEAALARYRAAAAAGWTDKDMASVVEPIRSAATSSAPAEKRPGEEG